MSIRRLSAVLVVATALVQVGSAASASVASQSGDPCTLVSAAKAAKALGVPTATPVADPTLCRYSIDGGAVVTIATAPISAALKHDLAVNSKQAGAKKVAGIKKAYAVDHAGRVLRSDAIKGATFLTVTISSTTGADTGVTIGQLSSLMKVAYKNA